MMAEATIERPTRPGFKKRDWGEHPFIDLVNDGEFRKLSDEEVLVLQYNGMSDEELDNHFKKRENRLKNAELDPFEFEFPLPHWAELEAAVLRSIITFVPGGNNPGKSRWAASFVMRVLMKDVTWDNCAPDNKVKVLMIAQDDDASRMFQQDKIYAQLPAKWRGLNESQKKPHGFARCINYSDKNGFTEGNFVLPRPMLGQCWFKTVAQYVREPKSFEGPDYDLVIADEGTPQPLLKSLLGRVSKRGGKIVYLLTCVNGYDQALGQALEGARLLKTLPMQFDYATQRVNPEIVYPELRLNDHQTDFLKRIGCPAGHMPYLMQPLNPHNRVVFMWNIWNPFQPAGKWRPKTAGQNENGARRQLGKFWSPPAMPAMMDSCVGDPKWRVLVKMFGWIERVGQLAIGNFNPEVHVVRGERREALDKMIREGKASVYMASDPETQRSHAILWQATFAPCTQWPNGLKYLFDESPRTNEGDWVDANGERGEGQYIYKATGANWYKRYIREREREWGICDTRHDEFKAGEATLHECIVLRRGDPRGFATEESTATGTRSLFDLYLEDHSSEHPDCYPMIFLPAKIRRASSLDIDLLIDLFRYDEDRAQREGGLSAENTPMRLVSDRCENWIRCALNYTLTDLGKADEDNPNRDFIDADRYLNSAATSFIDNTTSGTKKGRGFG